MKHQTPESMKFKKLQRRLGVSRVVVTGTLELLWITAQKNTPRGDIGKFTNEEIAIECDWEDDPETLVDALVETGWLDRCDEHRLIIHDWESHAPGWVKRQLARHKQSFVTPKNLLPVTDDDLEATPNPTQPNPTQPNPTQPIIDRSIARPTDQELPKIANRISKVLGEGKPLRDGDRELAYKAACMDFISEIDGAVLSLVDTLDRKIRGPTPPRNPFAYFKKSLISLFDEAGLDFRATWESIEVPRKPQEVPT